MNHLWIRSILIVGLLMPAITFGEEFYFNEVGEPSVDLNMLSEAESIQIQTSEGTFSCELAEEVSSSNASIAIGGEAYECKFSARLDCSTGECVFSRRTNGQGATTSKACIKKEKKGKAYCGCPRMPMGYRSIKSSSCP